MTRVTARDCPLHGEQEFTFEEYRKAVSDDEEPNNTAAIEAFNAEIEESLRRSQWHYYGRNGGYIW